MRKVYSTLTIGLLVLMVGLLFFGCRSKEVESALIYINQQNDWDKAMEQLHLAVQVNPADVEAHVLLGKGYGHFGDYEKMVEEFASAEKLMAGAPNAKFQNEINFLKDKYWRMSFNKGVQKVKEENMPEAIKFFSSCVLIDPERPEAYKNLAFANVQTEKLDEAIKNYNAVLGINPKDTEALSSLANLYISTEEYEKCIETCDKILVIEPENVSAIAQKAMSYDFLGDSEKAFQAYEVAIASDPENKDLIFNLGRLYYQKNDYENAIARFEQVLVFAPDDYEANINIGNAYLLQAETMIKKYRDMDEKQLVKAQDEFNADNEKAKEFYKKAVPYLEKAIVLAPDKSMGWYNLGVAYVQAGESSKGEQCFKISDEVKEGNYMKSSDFIDEHLSHLK